jgi:hypothetical protein
MKRVIEKWTTEILYKRRDQIQYPDYQREPHVWNEAKRKLLIDSMLEGLDIPKLYLFKQRNDLYDCVDGQQRIRSVIEFLDGDLALRDGRDWDALSLTEQETIKKYEFTVTVITDATDDELRLLFQRLQIGVPLNAGEKLHAMKGEMRDFVFDKGKNHPFFKRIQIPKRRYARETVFAQICINSFYRSLHGSFYRARFTDLEAFFVQYATLGKFKQELRRITQTLDVLDEYFGERASELGNRASVISGYLFVEELIKKQMRSRVPLFVEFYLVFLAAVKEQALKGLDYDRKWRGLLDFQIYVTQAAAEKYAIEKRHKMLEEYFSYYCSKKKIKTDE